MGASLLWAPPVKPVRTEEQKLCDSCHSGQVGLPRDLDITLRPQMCPSTPRVAVSTGLHSARVRHGKAHPERRIVAAAATVEYAQFQLLRHRRAHVGDQVGDTYVLAGGRLKSMRGRRLGPKCRGAVPHPLCSTKFRLLIGTLVAWLEPRGQPTVAASAAVDFIKAIQTSTAGYSRLPNRCGSRNGWGPSAVQGFRPAPC